MLAARSGNAPGRSPASKPCMGSDDAVRNMTRSLRRRYSSARLPGGQGSAEPLEIGAKAMGAVQSLDASHEELPVHRKRCERRDPAGLPVPRYEHVHVQVGHRGHQRPAMPRMRSSSA